MKQVKAIIQDKNYGQRGIDIVLEQDAVYSWTGPDGDRISKSRPSQDVILTLGKIFESTTAAEEYITKNKFFKKLLKMTIAAHK